MTSFPVLLVCLFADVVATYFYCDLLFISSRFRQTVAVVCVRSTLRNFLYFLIGIEEVWDAVREKAHAYNTSRQDITCTGDDDLHLGAVEPHTIRVQHEAVQSPKL